MTLYNIPPSIYTTPRQLELNIYANMALLLEIKKKLYQNGVTNLINFL